MTTGYGFSMQSRHDLPPVIRRTAPSRLEAEPETYSIESARLYADQIVTADDPSTPFVRRIERHIEVDETCRSFIRGIQTRPVVFKDNADIFKTTSEMRDIYILQSGWMVGYSHTPNGQRHIFRIYQPGDMVGVEDINWSYRTSNVAAATPCVATTFTKNDLREMFETSPRLARTIFSMSMLDRAMLFDKLKAIGRMNAEERLATLLLQLFSRARQTDDTDEADGLWRYRMPLTQTELGDTVGLTNVSVSRAMTSLVERGLLERAGQTLTFPDPQAIMDMCDYTDRFAYVDRDWTAAPQSEREHA